MQAGKKLAFSYKHETGWLHLTTPKKAAGQQAGLQFIKKTYF